MSVQESSTAVCIEIDEPLSLSPTAQDEVRALGRLPAMGVPESFVARHPFPGPGLAVRVLGDVTAADHLDVLREVRQLVLTRVWSGSPSMLECIVPLLSDVTAAIHLDVLRTGAAQHTASHSASIMPTLTV